MPSPNRDLQIFFFFFFFFSRQLLRRFDKQHFIVTLLNLVVIKDRQSDRNTQEERGGESVKFRIGFFTRLRCY